VPHQQQGQDLIAKLPVLQAFRREHRQQVVMGGAPVLMAEDDGVDPGVERAQGAPEAQVAGRRQPVGHGGQGRHAIHGVVERGGERGADLP